MKIKLIVMVVVAGVFLLVACKSRKEKLSDDIGTNEQKLFSDSTHALNNQAAEDLLKMYGEYSEKYPQDSLASAYLFKAADLSNGLRKYNEAIQLYSQFREKYPNDKKAAACLFLQAFIYDNNMKETEKAKKLYAEFLKKYPSHELAPSAKASLDQLNSGLSNEDLIKMFEARQDSLARAGK
jgi:outer membrane assembly lipoprotein YfiO